MAYVQTVYIIHSGRLQNELIRRAAPYVRGARAARAGATHACEPFSHTTGEWACLPGRHVNSRTVWKSVDLEHGASRLEIASSREVDLKLQAVGKSTWFVKST